MSGGSHVALYRKYRPTKLDEVIGQNQISQTLANSVREGNFSHAYLFIGPRGTGKTSVARILAHLVNNFDYQVEDSYLDIIEIDAASNTGVDNIRELREKAIIAPTDGQYKVYIIDEIHMLTKSAANALLKTLEEPPAHVIFIMATTDAHKVPITISSRAQVFQFNLVSPEIMVPHLQNICQIENIAIDDAALEIIAKRGGGSFRDTLSLLDQISNLNKAQITATTINAALGLPSAEQVQNLIQAYTEHDIDKIRETLSNMMNSGLQAEIIASEMIDKLVTKPTAATISLLDRLTNIAPPFAEAKLLVALISPESKSWIQK